MKKLIALLIVLLMSSCDYGLTENYKKTVPLGNRVIETIEFDGCEYVYLRRLADVAITHKGNCKNSIHK